MGIYAIEMAVFGVGLTPNHAVRGGIAVSHRQGMAPGLARFPLSQA
jgi:hypothetical protein